MSNENGAIGWDDEVSEDNAVKTEREAFIVLPNGTYPFTVNKLERKTYKGSDKLPPCNEVDIGLIIDGGKLGKAYVTKHFYMHTKTLGMIYDFLTAIGLHKKGEGANRIPWNKVEQGLNDLGGRAVITSRTYNGRDGEVTTNDIKSWITPEPEELEDIPF